MGRQGKIMLDVPSGTLAAMAVLGMAFLLGGGAGCLLGGMVNGAGGSALFVGSLAQKLRFCAKLKRVECSARFFRACQEKRFLTRSQKEVSGVLSCGAASESSVSEEDVVSSSGRPAVFITNFTLARTPSALPV